MKYQRLKAQAVKLRPHKLKEQGGKEEANHESDLHQEYAYSLENKEKQQLLKKKEKRHGVHCQHQAVVRPMRGACTAAHLLGSRK